MRQILSAIILSLGFCTATVALPERGLAASVTYSAWFLDQMSIHHKDAIEMGSLARDRAENSELKAMAAKVVTDQSREIEEMAGMRKEHFSTVPLTRRSMPKMDMAHLKNSSGKEFDLMFIDMMIKHHGDGVKMAKEAMKKSSYTDIKKFALGVSAKQTKEIHDLRLLKAQISEDDPIDKK